MYYSLSLMEKQQDTRI